MELWDRHNCVTLMLLILVRAFIAAYWFGSLGCCFRWSNVILLSYSLCRIAYPRIDKLRHLQYCSLSLQLLQSVCGSKNKAFGNLTLKCQPLIFFSLLLIGCPGMVFRAQAEVLSVLSNRVRLAVPHINEIVLVFNTEYKIFSKFTSSHRSSLEYNGGKEG